ncbi:hypothetical protein GK107_00980 [Geobacillus thermoleovorans]|uniref:hypothetical protein n=1 Tax=Geobacillus TaxID=129337 RepID=UPI0009C0D01E|nr:MULTISPECIES: hypothetical protein [Geobacillus]OQP04051.1 hypothetical protein B1690_16840 [Geobacillus sp. 46C-IIa]QNU27737.1 hypothetical protein IC803_16185 [Geobacillus sp. 46C-IIa]UPT58213.1 hypothetical protein GK107_00980 [Geobacillus thermoleovorans]
MLDILSYTFYILLFSLSTFYSFISLQKLKNIIHENSRINLKHIEIEYSKSLVNYPLKDRKGKTAFLKIDHKYLNIVAILNSNCSHCTEHFEEFWYLLTSNNLKISLQILINENSNELLHYLDLVDPNLSIFQYKNDLIDEFRIPYYPAFIVLNKQGKIKFSTPDLYELYSLFLRRDSLLTNN